MHLLLVLLLQFAHEMYHRDIQAARVASYDMADAVNVIFLLFCVGHFRSLKSRRLKVGYTKRRDGVVNKHSLGVSSSND